MPNEKGNVIIVKLMGGLGNQMFQYALGRHLAEKNKAELRLDFFDLAKFKMPRKYELDVFNINAEFASVDEIKKLTDVGISEKIISKILRRPRKTSPLHSIEKKEFCFDPEILNLSGEGYLEGYWQTEKYFKNIEQIIRSDFAFKYPQTGENKELSKMVQSCNSVSVHVRRGDYAGKKETKNVHGCCSMDYYYRCIEYIIEKVKDPYFIIFSDDINWLNKNFIIPYKMKIVDNNGLDNSYEDMHLMSQCKHNIIANSSFSWWAAWLNPNPDKIVIAPKKWVNLDLDTSDLIPHGWIRI
jgi:hypothetical protein